MINLDNAHVVVGDGTDIDVGHVGVNEGLIVEVGSRLSRSDTSDVTIDLEGRTVVLGFIDLHTHMAGGDLQIG